MLIVEEEKNVTITMILTLLPSEILWIKLLSRRRTLMCDNPGRIPKNNIDNDKDEVKIKYEVATVSVRIEKNLPHISNGYIII